MKNGKNRGAAISAVYLSVWVAILALIQPARAQLKAVPKAEKHRIVLLTDIGGDVDDMQSLTRFLMYADQYDIEGLIATSIRIFPNQKHRPPDGDPQPRYLVDWVKAYGQVRDNLLKHSEGWPEPEALLTMIRKGAKTGRDGPFIIETGISGKGSGHLPLDQIIGKGKDTGASMHLIEVVDRDDPRPVTHVRFNHGPLGALTPLRNKMLGEADSETFLGLIPNGLSAMDHPDWGGWGGRFQRKPGSEKQWIDLESNLSPDAMGSTITRWAPHFQNDYQARMDWCVKGFNEANHPPRPVVNGDESLRPLEITAKPGQRINLDATGSSDIDNNQLFYEWKFFPEAGTYSGQINLENPSGKSASFVVPQNAAGKSLQVLLVLTDGGTPQLTRYRRVVVRCEP